MTSEKLLVIDGFNLLSRAYFATAYNKAETQLTKNSKGLYTNALRVFFQKLFQLVRRHTITHIAIAWDVKREETDRRINHAFYKATRNELPSALIQQYETLYTALEQMNIVQLVIPPHEADDVIGSLTNKWSLDKASPCLIYSNDKDLFQLLNAYTSQIIAQKRQENLFTLAQFRQTYGIESSQWIDVKALLGDPSDNIPGCPGVGAKSALPLIQQYGTIEQLFTELDQLDPKFNRYKKKLMAGQGLALVSKELVTIKCNISVIQSFDLDQLTIHIEKALFDAVLTDLEVKVTI